MYNEDRSKEVETEAPKKNKGYNGLSSMIVYNTEVFEEVFPKYTEKRGGGNQDFPEPDS